MEIHNWEEGPRTSNIAGMFTVYIPALGLSLHKLKAIRTKKGGIFIAYPSYATKDAEDKKTWHPYISFSDQRSRDFQKTCIEAIRPFLSLELTNTDLKIS